MQKNGEPAGTRTRDTLIKSQVLYQLSYGLPKCDLLYLRKKLLCQGLISKIIDKMKDNVALIIPARMASTRLPGKPLMKIGDKTMIEHVYSRVLECGFTHSYVATDADEIAEVVEAMGGKVIMADSPEYSCGTDRVCGAFAQLPEKGNIDYVVNIQGDMPFIDPDVILNTVAALEESGDDITTPAVKVGEEVACKESNVKLVVDAKKDVMYFSRHPVPHGASEFLYHIGIYGFRAEALQRFVHLPSPEIEELENIEPLRGLYHGMSIRMFFADTIPISVDTQEDLELARDFLYSTD